MIESHHGALLVGYATALLGWLLVHRVRPGLWPPRDPIRFQHPGREVGIALLALALVLGMGQLYMRGWLLPQRGPLEPVLGAVNQLLIFLPALLVPWWRGHSAQTVWLFRERLAWRLLVGVAVALTAVLAYTLARAEADGFAAVLMRLPRAQNLFIAAQVFFEDVVIALLFVRFSALLGVRWTVLVVAVLFSAGHVPALLAKGAAASELLSLILDAGLGIAALAVLYRSRDIVWFWCVHFCMDMMQFSAVRPG